MNIQVLDRAVEDLIKGFHFYEAQERGLGEYFLATLRADVESLRIYGGIHRQTYRHYHRLLSKRFPFAVYYTKQHETVFIQAVVDCRRDSGWIRKHLSAP